MSEADRVKWDARFGAGQYAARAHPSALVAQWAPELPRGRVLDVACGAGRNSLFLAASGRDVDAVDISAVGLELGRRAAEQGGLAVRWIEADLEQDADAALPPGPYEIVLVVRYVHRQLMPALLARLAVGGVLVCEQHLDSPDDDIVGPRSADYRLRPNELLHRYMDAAGAAFRVRYYREGRVVDPDGRAAALAQLVVARV